MNEPTLRREYTAIDLHSPPGQVFRKKPFANEDSGDAIMAKTPSDFSQKLAAAALDATKEARMTFGARVLRRTGRQVTPAAGVAPTPRAAPMPGYPQNTYRTPGSISQHTIGGQPMAFSGSHAVLQDHQGHRLPMNEAEQSYLHNRLSSASNLEAYRMRTPEANRTMLGGFGARLKDFAANPVTQMIGAPIAANAVLSRIPGGKDEHGNDRSMADTTAGQLITHLGAPLAAGALSGRLRPNMSQHLTTIPTPQVTA